MSARRTHWKKPPRERVLKTPGTLSLEEQACARVALEVLRIRCGSYNKVAERMKVHPKTVARHALERATFTVGMVLEVARLAGVTFDDVVSGRFPAPGSCPMCGQPLPKLPRDGDCADLQRVICA